MENKSIILVLATVMCLSVAGCISTDNSCEDSNITTSANTSQTQSVELDDSNTDDSQEESIVKIEKSSFESTESGFNDNNSHSEKDTIIKDDVSEETYKKDESNSFTSEGIISSTQSDENTSENILDYDISQDDIKNTNQTTSSDELNLNNNGDGVVLPDDEW